MGERAKQAPAAAWSAGLNAQKRRIQPCVSVEALWPRQGCAAPGCKEPAACPWPGHSASASIYPPAMCSEKATSKSLLSWGKPL